MSMATGVEARVPFLDFELVRIMNALPVGLKVKGWQGKYVLKKAMEPLLPREIIYREKAGFGLPIRAWLRNNPAMMNMYLDEKRLERQGLFRSAAVRRLLVEQLSGHADHAYTLFTLLCQQVWLDTQPRQV
jgi:asparagine synthase (glutamine-hydrolysing)